MRAMRRAGRCYDYDMAADMMIELRVSPSATALIELARRAAESTGEARDRTRAALEQAEHACNELSALLESLLESLLDGDVEIVNGSPRRSCRVVGATARPRDDDSPGAVRS